MSRKIVYYLVGLAFIFFIISLIIFFKSKSDLGREEGETFDDKSIEKIKELEYKKFKIFFLTKKSRYMRPVPYEIELSEIKEELYKKFVNLLLIGKIDYISPIPEGLRLRTLYYIKKKGLLILDFSEELINQFPGGSSAELEFIYFIVDNICYNFREIKKVKIMISGNEYRTISGHIDIESPFYPDYRYIRDEK